MLIDRDETLARIEQYAAAAKAAEAAEAAALAAETSSRSRLAEMEAELEATREQQTAALAKAEEEFGVKCLQRENAVVAREKRLSELEAKATADAKANATLKAELDRRFARLREAAA